MKANSSHDISFLDQSDNEIGLMLATDKDGTKMYAEVDDESLAQQFFSGAPGYANLPPEKEIQIFQDNFIAGCGQEIHDTSDPKRYWKSFNMDLRDKGRAMGGPSCTAIAKPIGVCRAACDFNDKNYVGCDNRLLKLNAAGNGYDDVGTVLVENCEDVWNTYQNSNCTIAVDATDKKAGTNSLKVTVNSACAGQVLCTETLSDVDLSSTNTITLQAKSTLAADAGDLQIVIAQDDTTWTSPTSFEDPNIKWANEGNTYDDSTETAAENNNIPTESWGGYLVLKHAALWCDKIRYYIDSDTSAEISLVDLDAYYNGAWHDIYQGSFTEGEWITKTFSDDVQYVTQCRIRGYNSDASNARNFRLAEVDFGEWTAEALDFPALTANTWTKFNTDITTPSNFDATTRVLLYSVTDLGTEPYIIRLDDLEACPLPENITDLHVFASELYIALGKDNKYWVMTTAEAFTESGQADGKADFFQSVGSTLWKACKPNEMKSATTPEVGGWSGATTVGSTTEDILALAEWSGALYIRKEDMPWYIDTSGDEHRLIPETASMKADTTGDKAIHAWDAKIYFPYGSQGLIEYDTVAESQAWRSPAENCTNSTEYVGKVQAISSDHRYLYLITDNDDKVELLACRSEVIDGTSRWVIHPLAELTLTGCQFAHATSVYKKRLYVFSTDEDESVYYYPLPTKYGDIDSDTDYTFVSDGYVETSRQHANFKGDSKAYIKLTLTMEDTSANEYFEGHYRLLGTAAYTDIGDFKTSPTTTKYIPVTVTAGLDPSSVMIQYKFVCKLTDTSTTPKLLSYDCRGIWYPTKRKIIACRVKCADKLTLKNGGMDSQTAADIKTAIEEARDDATWPVTTYDIDGETIYTKFLSAKYTMAEVGKNRNKERVWDLTLLRVALS